MSENRNFMHFSLHQLQLFLAVCEHESFTRVSQLFHTTQSAVSKSMAAMEYELGLQLFIRGKKRFEVTEAARYLEKEWKSILKHVDYSVREARLIQKNLQRSLCIGEPDSMKKDRDYMPAVSRFQKENPEYRMIYMECPIGELVDRLSSGELDVIFTIDYEIPALQRLGMRWRTVAESPDLLVMAHRDNPLAESDSLSIEDLKQEEFIMPSPAVYRTYASMLFRLCEQHGFRPKTAENVLNFRSAVSTLRRTGKGIILANRFLYDGDDPSVKKIRLKDTESSLILAWNPGSGKKIPENFIEAVAGGRSAEN